MRSKSEEFRVLPGQYPVPRLHIDRTSQILTRAVTIPREAAAEGHCVKNMVCLRFEHKRAAEMMFGPFDIARIQPLDAVIEVVFSGERGRCDLGGSPLADLDVGPSLVRDGSGRPFHGLQKARARFRQLSLRKELDGEFVALQLQFGGAWRVNGGSHLACGSGLHGGCLRSRIAFCPLCGCLFFGHRQRRETPLGTWIYNRTSGPAATPSPPAPGSQAVRRYAEALTSEQQLREKLRKISALFEGAATVGERAAAAAAIERVKRALNALQKTEIPLEIRFTLPDRWQRRLFTALCRRYGLEPYRYNRQRHTTVMVRAPRSFVDQTLWPEYLELKEALDGWLNEATERIIREEVYGDAGEAPERPERA